MSAALLPPSLVVLERGWLSANNIIGLDGDDAELIDSGYVTHADQTVALVRNAIGKRRLTRLINTHSHSDHIGCNAAVQSAFGCTITVPQGIAGAISDWDRKALLLSVADQQCDRFAHDDTLAAGDRFIFGGLEWRALAAPGHDMDALVFHNPDKRILISGDALWQDGFGVQFAELFGTADGLAATRKTLEAIGRLSIDGVIPGHGACFGDVDAALGRAFARLAAFEADGERMARNAIRALLSFSLMECRSIALDSLPAYLQEVAVYREINRRFLGLDAEALAAWVVADLERAGVARRDHGMLHAS